MWYNGAGIIFTLVLFSSGVQSGQNKDVQGEINKITDMVSKIERPNQIMIDSFVQQIQTYCPNKTIDESVYKNISTCMDSKFNNTALEEDIREAIPAGKLDEVFHDICKKWPVAKGCMQHIVDVIDDCWAQGDKVNRVMDSMVRFFCGDNDDGARIALFFADGGIRCLDDYGDKVKECVMKSPSPSEPTQDDICRSVKQIHDCVHHGLKECDDSTPENLVSSMLKVVAKAIDCPAIHDPPSSKLTSIASYTAATALLLPSAMFVLYFGYTL